MATVRLQDDVNDRLKATAAADPERSVTQLVDHLLRIGLGMVPAPAATVDRPREPAPAAAPAARAPGRASVGRPGGRARGATRVTSSSCTHPIGRRIGNVCAVCGTSIAGR